MCLDIKKRGEKKAFIMTSAHNELSYLIQGHLRPGIAQGYLLVMQPRDGAGTFERSVAGISKPPALIDGLSIYHAR